ncbi:sulfatase [Tichowtungia aerotolerans]|uniref:Sulfatase-like hydrolase/transferase n=1 Tax=Tichowtungia aerotolerans TaxID=2697043 RepID=A0A6P1MAC2_9BACT|nr:sulfatase [Tichowtungia aerotolerans]QHI70781.1 sulfatase-like hydrolase/transferase [Tichowtungia aerotolerans]
MKQRNVFTAVFGLLAGCAQLSDGGPAVRNIVFILVDDLGIRDLGCYGSDYYETPNCDRLAAEGMRFTEAYAAHAVCSPTRASILTGRYPARLHLTAYIPGQECPNAKLKAPQDWIKYLRLTETTYAEALRDAGFSTCHIGKWHVSPVFGPENHGFETVTPWMKDHSKAGDDPWFVHKYTEAAERFIEKNKDRPFLLTLSHGTVHVPLYENEDLIDKYRKKTSGSSGQNNPVYAAMVERMDWSVGRVLSKLKELNLDENTAVVFFSDNGGLMNVYDKDQKKTITATCNLPHRGGKSQMYEGGIRVPLIVRWPGVTSVGSECDVPVISTDLYPTFLQMVGLPLLPKQHLDGLCLEPLLSGSGTLKRNALYWHYPHYQTLPPHGAIRCNNWKLVEHYEDGKVELFNLKDDPEEAENLASAMPERAQQLQAWLHEHLAAIGAQMPTSNPEYNPDVFWRKGSFNAPFDSWERKQDDDPRRCVEDESVNYGALRNN